MAAPGTCTHTWKIIKSDTNIIVWNCNGCHSGPHPFIYECEKCKVQYCRPCTSKPRA
ncbi:hypothetical protein PMIN01_10922 [Paraphaeosphaeria minitans]|uniref:Uncharacterized protein n=2 Tax=Paraphaeosphaeria TaxID=125369 RepID=A0A9P6G8U4_9PLEO|nr:uncharacterized protein CC84DRAFT_1090910 [Paraphaeosphaeria sporulosa]KAF9730964.1 hypothetical protein PMIN01_10922 [Paraphaeosphaeria minitans]OAG06111.1 hypothetical protein CC84DRAFT_1090910 [Paraphaeosphaeria sporulosa]